MSRNSDAFQTVAVGARVPRPEKLKTQFKLSDVITIRQWWCVDFPLQDE
jgi:hypothetical protein